jgi:hypothetical protein
MADNLSLWNSSIKFWACFNNDENNFECQLWYNQSDPNHKEVTFDMGTIKGNFKFYFPWFKKRQTGTNYLMNPTMKVALARGIEYIIIDASENKGSYSAEVILVTY